MKTSSVLLGLGFAAAVVVFAIHKIPPAVPSLLPPHPSGIAAPPVSGANNELAAAEIPRSSPAADRGANLQLTLRRWLGVNAIDAQAHEILMKELQQLLAADEIADLLGSFSSEELHTPFGRAVVEHWLNLEPVAAARWLATCPGLAEHYARLVALRLGEIPAELHAYCDQLPGNAWREHVLQHASLEKAETDPREAVVFAQKLVSREARINALETIAYAWFVRDAAAALQWAQTVPDLLLRERLFAVGAKAIARVDSALAMEWLAAGVKTNRLQQDTALSIAETQAAAVTQ